MTTGFKTFIAFFILGIPFWFFVNYFSGWSDDFFYWQAMGKEPIGFFIANIGEKYPTVLQSLQIQAKSFISLAIDQNGRQKMILESNKKETLPIASLTKLMTGVIVDEFYQPGLKITISKKAVSQFENTGALSLGETLRVSDLLYIMLIESSNDAAVALTEVIGTEKFVDLMNIKAQELAMTNTRFYSANGLDPEESGEKSPNLSTAEDLAKLGAFVMEKPIIFNALSEKEYPLYLEDGRLHHILKNTNELLGEFSYKSGGKTGYTGQSGGCLIFLIECKDNGKIINVLLNSPDRFGDMRKLVNYALSKRQCN